MYIKVNAELLPDGDSDLDANSCDNSDNKSVISSVNTTSISENDQ